MQSASFTNFSNEEFVGYWDGKPKRFKPGQSMYMPDYLAKHFAKHLTNRELLKKGFERSTSPKFPEQVPEFMELFNQAYQPDEEEIELTDKRDPVEIQIDMANKNRDPKAPKGYEIIEPPADDEEEEFEAKPVETTKEEKSENKTDKKK